MNGDLDYLQNSSGKSFRSLIDEKLIHWMKSNIASETKLPKSFDIRDYLEYDVYSKMGEQNSVEGIIERIIVNEGLVIYDGAVSQIALSILGGTENFV